MDQIEIRLLQQFHSNDALKGALRDYVDNFLIQTGGKWAMEGRDTKGVADAKKLIDGAFDNLDAIFKKKEKKKTINESR